MKIGIINQSFPHGSAAGRESLDAVLALSAFSEDIAVFFIDDGVFQLLPDQDPSKILQRNYLPTFGMLDLYDIEQVFVCQQSCEQRGIDPQALSIAVQPLTQAELVEQFSQQQQLIRF